MKLQKCVRPKITRVPAAFRRLCVETHRFLSQYPIPQPAAFRRLCVETDIIEALELSRIQPPSGGCVLKLGIRHKATVRAASSRLQAAVC